MNFMGFLQNGALWLIIIAFLGIIGYEMFNRAKMYKAIQDAKHKKLLKDINKED